MWHPLRLAEDFATADILTGGRVVFGVGRGYHTREVETFGAPMLDADANRDLFEEQVEIVHEGVRVGVVLAPAASTTRCRPRVPYRGYELSESHARPPARPPARRVLAADRVSAAPAASTS